MIKRTNKISASRAMITKNEEGILFVTTYDKDGNKESELLMEDFIEDFINKRYISISVGYDINL